MYKKIGSCFAELAGCFLIAVAMASFATNFNFSMTGISGIILILYRLYRFPLGILNVVLNIPLILLCYRMLGKKISDTIEECCHRGATIMDVYGGYQQEKKQMVFCACNNKELYCVEKAVKKADPESFMTIWESKEVQGNGFHMFSLGQNHE